MSQIYKQQTGGGGVVPPGPNQSISDFDDFISWDGSRQSKFSWIQSFSADAVDGTSTNPGILIFSGPGGISLDQSSGNNTNPFVLGGGSLSNNWVFRPDALSTNTDNYTLFIGLADIVSAQTPTTPINGVYFQYSNNVNSGNFQIVTNKASVTTTMNTATPATTSFMNFGIDINSTATAAQFFINGSSVGTIATTIPTASINPSIIVKNNLGTIPDSHLDLWYYTQTLTVAR